MLPDKVKENIVVGIIMASHVEADTKTELIDYVRSRSAEKQASFRLGQMDMRMSAADSLRKQAEFTKGICHSTMLADADIIESLVVI